MYHNWCGSLHGDPCHPRLLPKTKMALSNHEAGKRFILTFGEYATRYAEVVLRQKTDAETLAEAVVDIYSQLAPHP
ncbi:hypothetical protein PoB_001174100 [Plakobranchus ocellatus]|uniref:Uncharacterized protein n=1 Tax=Plakobranchus ocellatus TaxID=259542 RepID=A0AAV3YD39_9GAST|nr:hypothetical protein PoB_001174100 [Plakobranchus ocellatus]